MKTTLANKTTAAAVKFVSSVIPRSTVLPVLSEIHCYANGSFKMVSTDLDMFATAHCPAQTTSEGVSLIPRRALIDATSAKSDFEIETGENEITFRAGALVSKAPRMNTADFPPILETPTQARRTAFPADQFIAAVRRVIVAASKDESRYVLNGVCLEISTDGCQLIATDGRRLHVQTLSSGSTDADFQARISEAQAQVNIASDAMNAAQAAVADAEKTFPPVYIPVPNTPHFARTAGPEVLALGQVRDAAEIAWNNAKGNLEKLKSTVQLLIPIKTAKLILAMPIDKKAPGEITVAEWITTTCNAGGETESMPFASFTLGDYSIATKQIQGNYPHYRQVIPQDHLCDLAITPLELSAAVTQAAKVCTDKSNSVKLELTRNNLNVTAKSDNGESRAQVAVNYYDKEMSIAFNPKYILETCVALKDVGAISFQFIDELSPGKIVTSDGFLAVIMPMRLS